MPLSVYLICSAAQRRPPKIKARESVLLFLAKGCFYNKSGAIVRIGTVISYNAFRRASRKKALCFHIVK